MGVVWFERAWWGIIRVCDGWELLEVFEVFRFWTVRASNINGLSDGLRESRWVYIICGVRMLV